MRSRLLFAITAVWILGACATPAELQKKREAAIPPDQRSYVIGRFAVDCVPRGERCNQRFDSIGISYRSSAGERFGGSIDANEGGVLGGDTIFESVDVAGSEKWFHFCEVFPPGQHAFFTFRFYNYAGGGTGYFLREEDHFSLPFSTRAGEVVYVGRLKLTTSVGRNVFGMPLNAPGILLLSSDAARDIPAALDKCPTGATGADVRDASLRAGMAGVSPVVRDDPAGHR